MAGTVDGGRLAAVKNRKRHGNDFYRRIGRMGGSMSRTGGFASKKVGADGLTGRQRAKLAGAAGGEKSKRGRTILARL